MQTNSGSSLTAWHLVNVMIRPVPLSEIDKSFFFFFFKFWSHVTWITGSCEDEDEEGEDDGGWLRSHLLSPELRCNRAQSVGILLVSLFCVASWGCGASRAPAVRQLVPRVQRQLHRRFQGRQRHAHPAAWTAAAAHWSLRQGGQTSPPGPSGIQRHHRP